jgi:hypothetical protein
LLGVGPVQGMELLEEFPGKEGLKKFKEWWGGVQRGKQETEKLTTWKKKFVRSLLSPFPSYSLPFPPTSAADALRILSQAKAHPKLIIDMRWPDPQVVRFPTSFFFPAFQSQNGDANKASDVSPDAQFDAYYRPTVQESDERFSWGTVDLDGLRMFVILLLLPSFHSLIASFPLPFPPSLSPTQLSRPLSLVGSNEDRQPPSSAHQARERAQGGQVEGAEAGYGLVRLLPLDLLLSPSKADENNRAASTTRGAFNRFRRRRRRSTLRSGCRTLYRCTPSPSRFVKRS